MGRGRLLWRGGAQGALSASPIGAPLSRPAETQAGRRVSLRHTQLEGTCRPCTTYSRLASTRSVASSRRRADGRHGLRRDITAAGAAGCPNAVSHRNPHRRRQTPPRDGAGSAFAALIPIPATEWCTVSSSRSASNASAGYPQSASEPSGLRRLFRSTWSGLAWADTTMPVPQVVNVVVPNADDVRFDAHYPKFHEAVG